MKRFLLAASLLGCHATLDVDDLQFNRTEDDAGAGGGNCGYLTADGSQHAPIEACSRQIVGNESNLDMYVLRDANGDDGLDSLTFSEAEGGSLLLTPKEPFAPPDNGWFWFNENMAPYRYFLIRGNFALMVYLRSEGMPAIQPPAGFANGSALLIRTVVGVGSFGRWWMWDLGRQDATNLLLGTKLWEGEDDDTTSDSLFSSAELNHGCMMMCRVGDRVHLYRRLATSTGYESWQYEGATGSDVRNSEYQVGITAHKYDPGSTTASRFYWLSFREGIEEQADCLTAFGSSDPSCEMASSP